MEMLSRARRESPLHGPAISLLNTIANKSANTRVASPSDHYRQ